MRWVRVDIYNIQINIVRKERDKKNVLMINNVLLEWKMKREKTNVDIGYDSWVIWLVDRMSDKREPVRMVGRSD